MGKKIDNYIDSIVLPDRFKSCFTEDKSALFRAFCLDMLGKTIGMFKYDGLPETCSTRSMEIEMQTNGFCCITDVPNPAHGNAGLYCFRYASPAGLLNADRLPTKMIVVDEWLNYNKELEIDKDCIVIPNDPLWRGLGASFSLFAGQLADAETTMRLQLYNSRINKILSATDDKVIEEAKKLLADIKEGRWGVIGDSVELMGMMKALSSIDFTSPHAGSIKDTMEVLQYYRAQWFISLGLNDNFNMKREALNGTETESNANTLFALPLQMLKYRKEGIEKLNKKYGLNASVEFDGVWATAYEKYLLGIELQKAEALKVVASDDGEDSEDPADEPKEEETKEEPTEEKKDE